MSIESRQQIKLLAKIEYSIKIIAITIMIGVAGSIGVFLGQVATSIW